MHQTNAIERSSYVARSVSETNKRDGRAQRGWRIEVDSVRSSSLKRMTVFCWVRLQHCLAQAPPAEDHSIIRTGESRRLAVFCGICEAV